MATQIESGLKNIIVAVKQVPDTNQVKIDPETGTLVREGVPFIMNPFDTHAMEAGLSIKDRFGGQVIVLSMGPPNTVMTLRKCLAQGADQAILVSDRLFGGADTLATSYVLTEAIKRIERENGRIDVIICGRQTIDGDTAHPPGIRPIDPGGPDHRRFPTRPYDYRTPKAGGAQRRCPSPATRPPYHRAGSE